MRLYYRDCLGLDAPSKYFQATGMRVYRDRLFGKGYNDTIAPEHLPRGYLADALNCFIRTEEIVKRTGYTIIGDDVGSAAIQALRGVRFANGTRELLMVANGIVYKWTGSGNWATISGTYTLSATADIDIVIANNNAYFFDGANTVPKYNGTTITTVAAIPLGSMAKWFHNQLYVAGISGSPNNIQSSDLGDPENFTTGQSGTLSVNPNDGDYITGLGTLGNELLISKTMRWWSLTGFGTVALTLSNLNERITGYGTLAYKSIINTGNDLLYIGFLGDKPHIRSIRRTREATLIDGGIVSEAIENSLNGINKARVNQTAAIYDGRNAWFCVPFGAATTNNRVYMLDTITNGWVRHVGINANVFESFSISTTPQLYFGEASANSQVYVFDTSTSDNGTAINFSVTTKRYGADTPENKKKWKYFKVSAEEIGNYDVTVDFSEDGFTYGNLGTLNLAGTGAVFDNIILDTSKLGSTDVKKTTFHVPEGIAYYMQFQMYDTSATSQITIRNWEVFAIPRNIRE